MTRGLRSRRFQLFTPSWSFRIVEKKFTLYYSEPNLWLLNRAILVIMKINEIHLKNKRKHKVIEWLWRKYLNVCNLISRSCKSCRVRKWIDSKKFVNQVIRNRIKWISITNPLVSLYANISDPNWSTVTP